LPSCTPELGNILINEGLISSGQLEEALVEQSRTSERLGEILRRRGYISDGDLVDALAQQLGIERFDPTRDAVDPEALDLIPFEFARRYDVLPVRTDDGIFTVAMSDPLNLEARDHLRRIASRSELELEIILGTESELENIRNSNYDRVQGSRSVNRLIDKVVDEVGEIPGLDDEETGEAKRRAEDAGIVSLVNQIVSQAVKERATDIHIEPLETGLVIRYRVDGLLYDALKPPRAVYTGTISRIKILSNMDIAERRAAQDGRFSYREGRREVDIRVSSVPTIHGEKLVLRLLDKTGFNFCLRDLGFSEKDYADFRKAIHQPYGMILLSGPTGSGKTTTLYASLLELHSDEINITTIEDPVEYQIDRINQVQVNERKQLTFATALRYFLRQDPDVIMVGEIRDHDTAEVAIRAALTGHMVFSTIHANDAPTTAARLISMGTEPFMAASAMSIVAAQRLVRRNCPHCIEEYEPSDEIQLALQGAGSGDDPTVFRRGTGCVACKGRGYLGRVAVIEKMIMTKELRQLIGENRTADEVRDLAKAQGMKSLKQSGLEKVKAGMTTPEEILRVCLASE